ncbi:MAG: hemolysin III family protein [Myxococcota bacterium]
MNLPLRQKPKLRGVSHQLAAMVAVPAVLLLWRGAGTLGSRWGAAVYGVTLIALFSISALYHRPVWAPRPREILGRFDHSAIFLLIGGTYTPLGLVLGGEQGTAMLSVVWLGAAAGVGLSLLWPKVPKPLVAGLCVLLGWTAVPVVPPLFAALGLAPLLLIVAGGVLYTIGAAIYVLKRPDPLPSVFGYHEIFHLLVIVAAAAHFAAIAMALPAIG